MEEGFGPNKEEAINLLGTVIGILNEFDINHFLISGTLLGYVRHRDFIPWDDDIDLIVHSSINSKLEDIVRKYPDLNIFKKKDSKYDSIKICSGFSQEIPENESVLDWKKNCISVDSRYCWPFIDLFVYEEGPGIHSCSDEETEEVVGQWSLKIKNHFSGVCKNSFRLFSENEISFFHNEWQREEFFPPKQVDFLGIECQIPNNPDYFLSINFGSDYMTEKKIKLVNHKTEELL